MIRRTLISGLASLAAAPALAAAPSEKAKEPMQYVDVLPVAIPILADGRLVNYVFVSVRVQLTAMANAAKWRAKEPYFRDALARLTSRVSFASPKDYASIDGPRLIAAFQREATAIAGKDVKAVSITAETPKQRLGLPKPRPPGGAPAPLARPRVEIRP